MFVLNGYDSSQGHAASIVVPVLDETIVYNTSSVDVTAALITAGVLTGGSAPIFSDFPHAWIANLANALAVNITETFIAMSEAKNAGETPIFFARIEDSATGTALTTSDVSSVSYTIYVFERASIRSGGSRGTPVSSDWTDVSLTVSDCFFDAPVSNDPRVSFAYNFRFEPDTLTDNPFDEPGRYLVVFTITPTEGNRVPLKFEVALN